MDHRLKKYIWLAFIFIALVASFYLVAENASATTYNWDGGDAANQLASDADNWNPDGVPITADIITVDGTNDEAITWDLGAGVVIASYDQQAGYSGTLTTTSIFNCSGVFHLHGGTFVQGAFAVYTGSVTMDGGTLTGNAGAWWIDSGDFIQTGGTITTTVLRLEMSGIGKTLSTSATFNDHSLKISGNVTVPVGSSFVLVRVEFYLTGHLTTNNIASGLGVSLRLNSLTTMQVSGTMSGTGYFSYYDSVGGGPYSLPGLDATCTVQLYRDSGGAGGSSSIALTSQMIAGSLLVVSTHATNTMTLNLAGYDLTATSILCSTRGILTSTVAGSSIAAPVTINGAGAMLTQGAGISLQLNSSLVVATGSYIQAGNIIVKGTTTVAGASAVVTGSASYWFEEQADWSVTLGTVTTQTLNLNMTNAASAFADSYGGRYLRLWIGGNCAMTSTAADNKIYVVSLLVGTGDTLTLGAGELLYVCYDAALPSRFINNGTIAGTATSYFRLVHYGADGGTNDIIGDVDIQLNIYADSTATASRHYDLSGNITVAGLGVLSLDAADTMTLDLNGHWVNCSGIGAGVRGIIASSIAGAVINSSSYVSSAGASSQLNAGAIPVIICGSYWATSTGDFVEGTSHVQMMNPYGYVAMAATDTFYDLHLCQNINFTTSVNVSNSLHFVGQTPSVWVSVLYNATGWEGQWMSDATGALDCGTVDWFARTLIRTDNCPIITSSATSQGKDSANYGFVFMYDANANEAGTWTIVTTSLDINIDTTGLVHGKIRDMLNFWVNVTITDASGGYDWENWTVTVHIGAVNPHIVITWNYAGYLKMQFEYNVTNIDEPELFIEGTSWNFGDGRGSVEATPMHIYDHPGLYTVTVALRDVSGGIGYKTVLVQVGGTTPEEDAQDQMYWFSTISGQIMAAMLLAGLFASVAYYSSSKRKGKRMSWFGVGVIFLACALIGIIIIYGGNI
jgi:hypothetical protein